MKVAHVYPNPSNSQKLVTHRNVVSFAYITLRNIDIVATVTTMNESKTRHIFLRSTATQNFNKPR